MTDAVKVEVFEMDAGIAYHESGANGPRESHCA